MLKRLFPLDFSETRSIYLGGGTPSRLSPETLSQLVQWLKANIVSTRPIQWSIELNPEDVTRVYVKTIRELGFSRVSLGVQSFVGRHLKILGRNHSPLDSKNAITHLQNSGIEDINLDFLFGYPEQNKKTLIEDLREFLSYHPTHLSIYCLNIERKTALFRKKEWKSWQQRNENLIVELYETAVDWVETNGILQYEISNFSTPGYQSLQNLCYWNGSDYLGLGMGAHSFLFPFRWGNWKRWIDYRNALQNTAQPIEFIENLNKEQRRDEELMIGLRLSEGLNLTHFLNKYNLAVSKNWSDKISALRSEKLAVLENNHFKLTSRGMLIADEIAVSLSASIA